MPGRPAAGRRLHVFSRDRAVRAGAGQSGQVDAEILGQLPHRWLRQRPHAARVSGARGSGAAGSGAGGGGARGRSVGGTSGPGRCFPGAARGRPELDPVANQHGLALLLGRRAAVTARLDRAFGWWLGEQILRGGASYGIRRRSGGLRPACGLQAGCARDRADLHGDDRRPYVGGRAFRHQQAGYNSRVRARKLDDGLGGLDLHDDLVDGHRVTRLDMPLDDLRLGQALADIRQLEFLQL